MIDKVKLYKLSLLLQISTLYFYLMWKLVKGQKWINRRWLVRPFNAKRLHSGYFFTVFHELKRDEALFFNMTRMTVETFTYLHENLFLYLLKPRSNISPEQRLAVTLRYLSTGDSICSIAVDYRIGISTCYSIIEDTCNIIYTRLSPIYLKKPSKEEWKTISQGFLEEWNLPNCCGAIDGKHIHIKAPANSGSEYFNYKKSFSLVLLAVCNHKYEFTLFDVGAAGSESDGGVFARSDIGKAIRQKTLDFPIECNNLPGTSTPLPYFFVGDSAFQMTPNLMVPFPGRRLSDRDNIFNYRLSRARRTIENSFGILVSRWRFLERPAGYHPDMVIQCVLASICLHNFLMKSNSSCNIYCPSDFLDRELEDGTLQNGRLHEEIISSVIQDINNVTVNDEVHNARIVRETLANYFDTPDGMVPWQYEYIHRGSYQNS